MHYVRRAGSDSETAGAAVGADSVDDVVDGMGAKSGRKGKDRDGDIFEAEGFTANLAMEVDVQVIVESGVMAAGEAKLVSDAVAAVLDDVDQVPGLEECKRAGNDRLVHGLEAVAYLGHRERVVGGAHRFDYHNSCRRGLDSGSLQQFFVFHTLPCIVFVFQS